MKIIAYTAKENFLVDVSKDELARLTGYDGDYYRRRETSKEFKPGDEIDVNLLYRHHVKMKAIKEELARAKGIIDTCSAGITMADSIVTEATTPKVAESDPQS